MKKILITGISGFAGSHLFEHLLKDDRNKIFGTFYSQNSLINLGDNKEKATLFKVDLQNESEVKKLISETKPDEIYHLAALASAAKSFSTPKEIVTNNISSQINVLEEVVKNKLSNCRVLVVSSAEVYGDVRAEYLPIDENTPFNPTNSYAVSKLAQDFLGRQYFLSYGLKAIRVRPFNHIGPRQSPDFVVSAFTKKIAEIEKGKRKPIFPAGNLTAKRDFTDVRDMVKAYVMIMEKGEAGDVYNIGSGRSYKIGDILDMLLSFSDIKISVKSDKSLFRPIDNPNLVCNAEKIKKITGWEPSIPIEKTLRDTLEYWRNII